MFFTLGSRSTTTAIHSGRPHAKRASAAISLLAVLCLLLLPLAAAAQTPPTPTLLVKPVSGLTAEQVAAVIARNGGTEVSSIPALRLHVLAVDAASLDAVRASYAADPQVESVEVNQTRQIQTWPNDPLYPDQWYLPKIGWDQMFGAVTAAGTATVAILDTGVDAQHPDLAGNVIPGTSVLDGSDGTADPVGHGTRLAGIVAAQTDNLEGISSVAYSGVRIMPVTVLSPDGLGQDSDIIAGVVWAADHGADVILMAFSNPGFSQNLQDAIDYAWSRGAVLVAAAGNEGSSDPTFPAGDRGVMGVAATDENDQPAPWSNSGPSIFIAAPGTNMVTTDTGGAYTTISGTSTSAAIVAASAAFMKAVDPTLTNGIIVSRIAGTTDPAGTSDQTGNGRLNLSRANASTSTDSLQPAGVGGGGGPFLGPYTPAAGAKIDKIYSDAPLTNEGYQFAVGDTVYVEATNLKADGGYKLEALDANGVSAYLSSCITGVTSTSASAVPTTPSGSSDWTWVLHDWDGADGSTKSTTCTGTPGGDADNTRAFNVAQATAYVSSSLSTTTTTYGAGETAYVRIEGLKQALKDWSVTWIAPSIACANTNGGDRPNSDSNGAMPALGPDTTTPAPAAYLQYPPTTGDGWNTLINYAQQVCNVFSGASAGQWKLTLTKDPKTTVTFNVFTVVVSATKLGFAPIDAQLLGQPFSFDVQSQDATGYPVPVATDTDVTVTLGSGTGTLTGTLTGTILAGTSSVTISGVVYDKAESITLVATRTSGDSLTAGTSAAFTVTNTALLGTTTVEADGGTSASVTLTKNTLAGEGVLILIYRQANADPDSVSSITGPFTTSPLNAASTPTLTQSLVQSTAFATKPKWDVWAYLAKGNGSGGSVTVTFAQTNKVTVIDVIQIVGANPAKPIAQSAVSTSSITPPNSATVSLPDPASPANSQVVFVGTEKQATVTSTNPSGFVVLNQSFGGDSGGYGVWDGSRTSAATTVTANFSADPSTWGAISIEINMNRATTTTLASDNNPSTFGQSVTFTATVTATLGNPGANGTLTFKDGGTVISGCSSVALNGSSQATCTTSTLSAGSYSITAEYTGATSGGTTWDPSTSSALSQTVNKADQTITFGALSDRTFGDPDFTVSATASSGLAVSFAASGDCTVAGSSVHITGAGSCTITASQAGDGNYNPAPSVSQSFSIAKAGSTTTVTCPAGPFAYTGSPLTPCSASYTTTDGLSGSLTASYSNNTDAGTATASATYAGDANHMSSTDSKTFTIDKAGSTTTVTCPASVTYDGSAQTPCSATVTGAGGLNLTPAVNYTNNTDAGTATATVTYPGDTNHTGSTGSENFTIEPAAQSITVTQEPPTSAVYNSTFQVAATASSGLGVSIAASGSCSGSGTGSATITMTSGSGSCSITFDQPGNGNYNPAPPVTRSISAETAATSTTLQPDSNPAATGQPVTFTATVSSATAGTITGSVEFFDGATSLGTQPIAGGSAALSTSALAVGTHSITAVYGGDGNFSGSTSNTVSQVVDTPPTGLDDAYTVLQDGSLDVFAPGVLNNDFDGDAGQTVTAVVVDQPGQASAFTLNPDGSFHYVPVGGFTGTDTFTYRATDGTLASDLVTVTISVVSPTASRVAQNDAYYVTAGDTLTVYAPGVFANDNAAIGLGLVGGLWTAPIHDQNTFIWYGNGSFTYTPEPGFTGVDSFSYFLLPSLGSNVAMVTITVLPAGASLVANNDSYITDENTPVTIAPGVLDNDSGALTAAVEVGPLYGSVAFAADGSFTYTPNPGFSGLDSFVYRAQTGAAYSNLAMVAIKVKAATITTIQSTANPSTWGQPVTFTATVAASTAAGTPTGAVTFKDSGTPIPGCTALPLSGGQATCTPPTLSVETHPITAEYTGDANFVSSTGTLSQVVNRAGQTITFGALADKTFGDPDFTVTATTSSGLPVSFAASGNCTVAGNSVHITGAGSCTITASQPGDANYNPAPDVSQSFTIAKAGSTTTLTCPASVTYSGAVQEPCTATVSGVGGLNKALIVTYTANTNAGTATASASFTGDANHTASSDSTTFQISPASSTTTVTCPASVTYNGSAQTPCSAAAAGAGGLNQTLTVNYTNNIGPGTATASATFAGDGNHTGSSDTTNFTIISSNDEPPTVSDVTASPNPVPAGAPLTLTAYVTDPDGIGSVEYTVNGSCPSSECMMSAAGGASFSASFGSFSVGVYNICVVATDGLGNITDDGNCTLLAVYDPNAGFVTGGGWINSPQGASTPYPNAVGKANFGFVAKYQKGANIPTGQTEFQFQAGNLNFHSEEYQWLVVSGARAQYKGTGTINGAGTYGFMLTAIDGQISGGGVDKFRIKIWDKTVSGDGSDGVVYDNQVLSGTCTDTSDTSAPCTVLGGGSIQIRAK